MCRSYFFCDRVPARCMTFTLNTWPQSPASMWLCAEKMRWRNCVTSWDQKTPSRHADKTSSTYVGSVALTLCTMDCMVGHPFVPVVVVQILFSYCCQRCVLWLLLLFNNYSFFCQCSVMALRGGRGCLMSTPPPFWNLKADIWFHFTISCLVLLPSYVTLSVFIPASSEGRPGMSDVSPLSRISGLSFDSTLLSPLMFFCLVLLPFLSYRFLPAGPFF